MAEKKDSSLACPICGGTAYAKFVLREAAKRYEGRGSEHTSEQVRDELNRLADRMA